MKSLLNHILLAVLVAIILHIIMNTIYHNEEGLDVSVKEFDPHEMSPNIYAQLTDSESDNPAIITDETPRSEGSTLYTGCSIDRTDREVAKYVKDLAYNGKFLCDDDIKSNKHYSKADINQYRSDFLNFRSTTLRNTHQEDAVDKINEIRVETDAEHQNQGKTVAEVFNKLNQDIVIDRELPTTNVYRRSGHKSDYYADYSWMYDTDQVNNGGKFYDDIEADDNSILTRHPIYPHQKEIQ